ncbi:hypothetical protein O181_054899 [Austropuccinia psidii MF-1]|uniref:Peptidase A2 domain-containing protein n=1 Tax=Austropuccinia psidii MF-1 TaxID=1389203 RepID=A0A9Q3HU35_9BASI|nr:hypothetical protein [Austropuccinia psidii MF-1]
MPIQHSPPARQTRSQARAQDFLTPTPKDPLDNTPEVPQLRAQFWKEKHHPSRKEGGQEDQVLFQEYHEKQNEKSNNQEKKPESSKSNSSHPHNSSSSNQMKKKNFQKRDEPHSSLLDKYFRLMNSEKEIRIKEGLCTYCGGKHSLESCFKRPQNQAAQPSGKSLSEDHVVFNGLHCFPSREQLFILNTGFKNSLKFFVFSSLSTMFYSILIDSGATNSFIAKQFVHKYSLTMSELPEKIPLVILDSSESSSLFVTHHTKYIVELPSFPRFEWDLLVIDTPKGEDLILGFEFLNQFNPSIDWRQGLITFNVDNKDYYDASKYLSNEFSSAKSYSALVGDSRTTSFPSTVHIPSLNSYQSLLSSRDKVLKDIQDVGEDNSVSSLHLFFGDMDLPPSSYHDSLEELWDEEEEPEEVVTVMKFFPDSLEELWDEEEEPEEIETIMKAVPSAYHQYLDVFSKVKEEELPPHRACDHHIELKGSLPPVGVIYCLSNQHLDTLRAYIS